MTDETTLPDAKSSLKKSGTVQTQDEQKVFVMGALIIIGSGVTSMIILVGLIMFAFNSSDINQAHVAVSSGIIGTILGAASVNVQQVLSFYFGPQRKSNDQPATPAK